MEYEIDEICEVEYLGEKYDEVYDVGMVDSPHTFFANDILVHNSVYLGFGRLLESIGYKYNKKEVDVVKNFIIYGKDKSNKEILGEVDADGVQHGGIPKIDRDKMEELGKTLQNYVSDFINKSMKDLSLVKSNCNTNLISFKREVVASRGIFLKSKRYVLRVLNSEGTEMDKLKATGVDLVRSNTPKIVQGAHKNIIYELLCNLDEHAINEKLRDFRKKFFAADPTDVARPTSVNRLVFYSGEIDSGVKCTIPGQVQAAYNYNTLLDKFPEIATQYDRMYDGNKIKWMHLIKDNPLRIKSIAFTDKLPDEFELRDYLDYKRHFETAFVNGLKDIYDAIGWSMPNLEVQDLNSLFSF